MAGIGFLEDKCFINTKIFPHGYLFEDVKEVIFDYAIIYKSPIKTIKTMETFTLYSDTIINRKTKSIEYYGNIEYKKTS
jgi:hypothetical protein